MHLQLHQPAVLPHDVAPMPVVPETMEKVHPALRRHPKEEIDHPLNDFIRIMEEGDEFVLPDIAKISKPFPAKDISGFVPYSTYTDIPRTVPDVGEDGSNGILVLDDYVNAFAGQTKDRSVLYQGDRYQMWRLFSWEKEMEIDRSTLTHFADISKENEDAAKMEKYTGIDVTIVKNPKHAAYVRVYGTDEEGVRETIWEDTVVDCAATPDKAVCKIKCGPSVQECRVSEKRYLALGTKGKDETKPPSPSPSPPSNSGNKKRVGWKSLTGLATLILAGMAPWTEGR